VVKTSTSARSPLSPTLWPREAFRWWASLGLVVLLFLGAVVLPIIVAVVLYVFGALKLQDLNIKMFSWTQIILTGVGYVAWVATLATLLPPIARRPLSALGLRAPRLTDLAYGIAGAIAMLLAVAGTAMLQESIFHIKPEEVQVHWLREARGSLIAGLVVLACVAAPFVEEFAFRGFVFNAVLRYTPAWFAALFSAGLFGLAHFQPGNAGAILPLSAGGVVLATVYYRSGSLPASMLSHSLFNSFTVVAILVFHQHA
jgi:membrane protease YdiL (CAAX protease family)